MKRRNVLIVLIVLIACCLCSCGTKNSENFNVVTGYITPNSGPENIDIYIFAQLESENSGGKDITVPQPTDDGFIKHTFDYCIDINDSHYQSLYEFNCTGPRYEGSTYTNWSKYEGGKDFNYNKVLKAGSGDVLYIVGQFPIVISDYENAIKEKQDLKVQFGDYVTTINISDLKYVNNVEEITNDMGKSGLL